MKKLLALLGLCIATTSMSSQTYGEKIYPRTSSQLSSGLRTTITNPGFLMAGYRANVVPINDNFYIDKTDTSGSFVSSFSFSKRYSLRMPNGQACLSTGPVSNCYGVTVIESSLANGNTSLPSFAVAGSYDQGVFFSCLNLAGDVLTPVAYQFPTGATNPSKPLLMEANAWPFIPPGQMFYFIVGSYELAGTGYMYVLMVRQDGSQVTQDVYDIGASNFIVPKSITPSLTNLGDLVIVGQVNQVIASGTPYGVKGFFIEMTPGAGGTPNIEEVYGQSSNTDIDYFNSITPLGATGYLVGGYTDALGSGNGNDWFVNLTTTGGMTWSEIFTPNGTVDNTGGVVGVASCQNGSGSIVHYGVSYSPTKGSVVMKLDATGTAYTDSNPVLDYNTFEYTPSNFISQPTAITANYPMGGGGPDVGIQVYGYGGLLTARNHYFVEAYLNGADPCIPQRSPFGFTSSGPAISYATVTAWNTSIPMGAPCQNVAILYNSVTPLVNTICSAASLPGMGSNARIGQSTGVTETVIEKGFNLWPNPSNGKVTIHCTTQTNEPVDVKLYNNLGQLIKIYTFSSNTSENKDFEIELNGMNAGIYFLNANINGNTYSQKLVYSKD